MHSAITRLLTPSCEVVGHVNDGIGVIEAAARLLPDVVVLDLAIPGINGLEACRQIKAAAPHIRVILFTAADNPGLREMAARAGASAFVPKWRAGDDLLAAVQKAASGID